MSNIHTRTKIDDMRSRLYDRGTPPPQRVETPLIDTPEVVATTWEEPPHPKPAPARESVAAAAPRVSARRRKFRRMVMLSGVAFFFGAIVISTLVLFYGNNSISAENISIGVTGPFTIGGGETLSLQVGVTNSNAVPISAATLIIDYPDGTRSIDDNQPVFVERIGLETVQSNETVNVPVRAVVVGEENSEHTIAVSIEYRVEGSNATFFREAEPFDYKISSAPVVIRAESNERVSSGQETSITVTVSSNSQSTVSDVLVSADYPPGFDFTVAEPAPVRGQNIWSITALEPGDETTITIRGVMSGRQDDQLAMHFAVGAPAADDPTALAAAFSTVSTDFIIEQPFVDIELELDGQTTDRIVLEPGDSVTGRITITNSLSDIIYDTTVALNLSGNALSDPAVSQTDGFYDSLNNMIRWEPSSRERLTELAPGESIGLTFSLTPDEQVTQTPTIELSASVESRRVRESRVPEVLTGSTEATISVASLPTLISEARRVSGPVPPEVDEVTTYTVSFLTETASNNLNNVVVTATLPQYVNFDEAQAGSGEITFNPASRTVTWTVGNVEVGRPSVGNFTVTFRPSVSQIDDIPILVNPQRLRAEDAFTGSIVRAELDELTTEMSTELGFDRDNGRVVE